MKHVDIPVNFSLRENNFDLIRLLAAILVLLSHSYPLTGNDDFFKRFIGYGNGGSLAVAIFFSISGFLVTRSVLNSSFGTYVISRVLRIFPALCVVLLFDALIIGPLFTKLSLTQYFMDWGFFAHLKSIFLFSLNTSLPGTFLDNPYPIWVNGSLWSLPYEFFLYLCLPIFVVFRFLRPEINWLLFFAAIVGYVVDKTGFIGLSYSNQGIPIVGSVYPYLLLEYGAFFIVGSSIWIYRDKVPLSLAGIFVLFVLAWAGFGRAVGYAAYLLLIPYATIYLGLGVKKVLGLGKVGDISYGVYLYAFPIQQSIVFIFDGLISPLMLSVIALPLSLLCGFISNKFIELPALGLKKYWRERNVG